MRIPTKLKNGLGNDFLVTKGTNSTLRICTQEYFTNKLSNKLDTIPMSDIAAHRALRIIFSSASEVEEDNQGRSLLPKNLREFAKIEKDIVFIGVKDYIEVWAKEIYDQYMNEVDLDKAMEELQKHGV